jgi:hypothetical protein
VGYDTAVIGGTMALNSFQRDFKMGGMAKTQRDTTQGNIVSTFQVSISTLSILWYATNCHRLDASSVLYLLFPSPRGLVVRRL